MTTVFIDGNQGTTGLSIAQRLASRQDIRLLVLPEEQRKSLPARVELARRADITFLCLPDEASRELVDALPENEGVIIDASTAHRTVSHFAYGFPELEKAFTQRIQSSKRIAVPGCHASGALALLYPLLKGRLLAPSVSLAFTSLTGYSGGGKRMIGEYEAPNRSPALHAPRPYAIAQHHKHLPEIMKVSGLKKPPVFQPIVCDCYRGMLVSMPLTAEMLRPTGGVALGARGGVDCITNLYRNHYAGKAMIAVLGSNPEPIIDPFCLAGTDGMQIFVTGNDERMIAYARYDNLGKGASGAAIQCMNLHLGVAEMTGLVAGV